MGKSLPLVIVGGGVGGAFAAQEARRQGYLEPIVLVCGEPYLPYDRPPLSKEYLLEQNSEVPELLPGSFYSNNDIDIVLGSMACELDASAKVLTLENGTSLDYGALILATGSRARVLRCVPSLDNVFYLRSIEDSSRLRAALQGRPQVVIAGGGFIGLEVAAAASALGAEVSIVEIMEAPLSGILGTKVAQEFAQLHRSRGVSIYTSESVVDVISDSLVRAVVTSTGRTIPCDVLVVGVGAAPMVELAVSAGIQAEAGIPVDAHCRTEMPSVFAIGDVARLDHPVVGSPIRVEHWDSARRHASAAISTLVGKPSPCTTLPWFWSDQYGINFQYVGYAPVWQEVVLRGDPAHWDFSAFYLLEGQVVACLAAERPKEIRAAEHMISNRIRIPGEQLLNDQIDLREILRDHQRERRSH